MIAAVYERLQRDDEAAMVAFEDARTAYLKARRRVRARREELAEYITTSIIPPRLRSLATKALLAEVRE